MSQSNTILNNNRNLINKKMQSNSKESFHLLQLSDDSKSLSDLELPEITTQRKRKVRRKTRSKTSSQSRGGSHSHESCSNLSVWIALFMACGWLFILSYMMAVVHSENRRLQGEVTQLTATSQSVPDALQQWHESSKSLEQNQTEIYKKLATIQEKLELYDKELVDMKEQLNKKNEESNNNKVAMLEKTVGNFGAKIADLSTGVSDLKDKYNIVQKQSEESQKNYTQLKTTLDASVNKSSPENSGQFSKEILQNFTQKVDQDVKNLSNRLDSTNDTLSQKLAGLAVESLQYKKKLEGLTEDNANMSASLQSIENAWTNYKGQAMDFEKSSVKLNSEISVLKNRSQQLSDSVSAVNDKCDKYHSETVDKLKIIQTNASAFTQSIVAPIPDDDGKPVAPTALPQFLMNGTELTNNSTKTNTSAPVEIAAAASSTVQVATSSTVLPSPTSTSKNDAK